MTPHRAAITPALCTGRSRSARMPRASSAVTTGYSEASTAATARSPRLAARAYEPLATMSDTPIAASAEMRPSESRMPRSAPVTATIGASTASPLIRWASSVP